MSQTCTICRHPDHDALDAALTLGTPTRTIAHQFSVSRAALVRHQHHRRTGARPVATGVLTAEAQRLQEQAQRLRGHDLAGLLTLVRALAGLLVQMTGATDSVKQGEE